jgi:hypothetical protein
MPLLFNKKTLAAKPEGTYGTAETLTNAEVFRVNDLSMENAADFVERQKSDGTLGTDIGVPGAPFIDLKFWNFAHGGGANDEPNWASAFYPTCGMPSHASNGYRTSSTQSDWKGLTAAKNTDGRRLIGRGGMGNIKWTFEAGKAVRQDFTYKLAATAYPPLLTDTTQLTGMTFDGDDCPIWAGSGSLTIDAATTFKAAKCEVELNTNPFAREDPNAVGGYIGGYIQDIKPTLKIDVESVLVATKDWHTFFYNNTQFTVALVAASGTGGTATFTATNCQLKMPPKEGNRNGLLIDNLECNINGTWTVVYS